MLAEVLATGPARNTATAPVTARGERPGGSSAEAVPAEEVEALADRLRAALPERVLVARLVARELARLPQGLPLTPLDPRQRPPHDARLAPQARVGAGGIRPADAHTRRRGPRRPRSAAKQARTGPFSEAVMFRVNLGRDAKAEPGWLLPLICRRGGVTRREVGAIRVGAELVDLRDRRPRPPRTSPWPPGEPDPRAPHVTIEPVVQRPRAPSARAPQRRQPPRAAQRTAKQ